MIKLTGINKIYRTTFDLLKQKLCGIETEQNNNN